MQGVSNAVKQKLISEYIKTPTGRAKLAASLTQPLRTRRDYTSVGRKTFLVEQLPDGALPIYDKDPDVTAYVVGEEGENIIAVTKPRRVSSRFWMPSPPTGSTRSPVVPTPTFRWSLRSPVRCWPMPLLSSSATTSGSLACT
jgi:hypothetical protein